MTESTTSKIDERLKVAEDATASEDSPVDERAPLPRQIDDLMMFAERARVLLRTLTERELQEEGSSLVSVLQRVGDVKLAAIEDSVEREACKRFLQNVLTDFQKDEGFEKAMGEFQETVLTKYKAERDAKPRNGKRDQEIVRLRDQEKLSWAQIPRKLKQKNMRWVGPDDRLLSSDAVRRAYTRCKERSSQS